MNRRGNPKASQASRVQSHQHTRCLLVHVNDTRVLQNSMMRLLLRMMTQPHANSGDVMLRGCSGVSPLPACPCLVLAHGVTRALRQEVQRPGCFGGGVPEELQSCSENVPMKSQQHVRVHVSVWGGGKSTTQCNTIHRVNAHTTYTRSHHK